MNGSFELFEFFFFFFLLLLVFNSAFNRRGLPLLLDRFKDKIGSYYENMYFKFIFCWSFRSVSSSGTSYVYAYAVI